MLKGNKRKVKDRQYKSEYEYFKDNEQDYIDKQLEDTELAEDELPKERKKDWIWWLAILTSLTVGIYFTFNYMMGSREEVYNSAEIARLDAGDAVEQMFDEEDNEWIRWNLTQEEYDQIEQMVSEVPESSEKVTINTRLREAGLQLKDQLEAISLVDGLKTSTGEANVDLHYKTDTIDVSSFPTHFNPLYVEDLRNEYINLRDIIEQAHEIQERIRELYKSTDYLEKAELDTLDGRVSNLPTSDRKQRLTNDMKALFSRYEDEQEEIKKKQEEEDRKLREQLKREQEERERREREEAERKLIEEQERREREEAERERREREQAIREQEERERKEREEELRLEQERIEQELEEELEREEENNNNNNSNNQTGEEGEDSGDSLDE